MCDRGQLFLDFQGVTRKGKLDWYSVDVVRQLVTGERQSSAELTEDYASFLRDHLDEIERRFADENLADTIGALRELERARAKEMFG